MNKVDVTLTLGVDELSIELIHEIEMVVDAAMARLGFTREGTTKESHRTELRYRQFGVCV